MSNEQLEQRAREILEEHIEGGLGSSYRYEYNWIIQAMLEFANQEPTPQPAPAGEQFEQLAKDVVTLISDMKKNECDHYSIVLNVASYLKIKEQQQAGAVDAVELLEWIRKNQWDWSTNGTWFNNSAELDYGESYLTPAELIKLFKVFLNQQKIKE